MLTAPYVLPAEFRAHPTFLNTDNLRTDAMAPEAQTAELNNVLLMASVWADEVCNQPLGAHQVVQSQRAGCREGNLQLFADHGPVLSVSSVAVGQTPTSLTPVSDLSGLWVQAERLVLVPFGGALSRLGPGSKLFARWTYIAGHVATALTEDADVGATSLTVEDPTGILPESSYRLWEPGAEEAVTVAASFVPPAVTAPPTPVAVPLAAPTRFAHTEGASWSGMPADARLAITNYAVSLLLRPDTTAEDEFPDGATSTTRSEDSRPTGMGLVKEARRMLASHARVR